MSKLIKYIYVFHTLVVLIVGIVGWLITHRLLPHMSIIGYVIIPIFFYIVGLIFIWRFKKAPFHNSGYIINLFMLLKMVKIFTSFGIILIYWFIHQAYIRNFAIIFIIFYLISTLWETFIYMKMEKDMKIESDQNKHEEEREHLE